MVGVGCDEAVGDGKSKRCLMLVELELDRCWDRHPCSSTVEILPREVEKAFRIAWPNIVRHIEDEASSESDKKVKWYSDHHDNLTDDVRIAENKASTERYHR